MPLQECAGPGKPFWVGVNRPQQDQPGRRRVSAQPRALRACAGIGIAVKFISFGRMFGEKAIEFLKMSNMQISLQGRVLVADKMDAGGQRERLVHPGVADIEDVLRQDPECGEYSFHYFGMGLGVSNVRGAHHEVEILSQVELPEKFEGGNGAVCRQGGPKMLLASLRKETNPGSRRR